MLHNIIWLTGAHIPGSSKCRADKESRDFPSEDTEWMIDPTLLGKTLDALNFKPQIDLFASRLNRQFPIYWSFKPDPDASYIDAMCPTSASKTHPGQSNRDNGSSNVANTIMVPNYMYDVPSSASTNHTSTIQESSESSHISRGKPSTAQNNESSYLSTIRQQLEGLGFTSRSIAVIVASWREGTTSQYQTYLQKWLEFCKQEDKRQGVVLE